MRNLLIYNLKTDADDDVLGFTTDWIDALAAHYDHVDVLTMYRGRVAVAPNVTVHSVGRERGLPKPVRFLAFYRELARILSSRRIDVCFAHMMPLFAVLGWPLTRARGIPVVLWYGHKSVTRMLKLAHRLVDRVVTSTPAGFGLPSTKLAIVGQGIPEARFALAPPAPREGPFTLISVARLSAIKHLDAMIRALAAVLEAEGPQAARLVLLGEALSDADRAYKAELGALAESLGASHAVEFPGAVPYAEVAGWLKRSHLSLNLAPTGAIDKAVLESLAMGLPVLVQNRSFAKVFEEAGAAPERFIAEDLEPATLARLIRAWLHADPAETAALREQLSASVLAHHGLKGLAARIAGELDGACQKAG